MSYTTQKTELVQTNTFEFRNFQVKIRALRVYRSTKCFCGKIQIIFGPVYCTWIFYNYKTRCHTEYVYSTYTPIREKLCLSKFRLLNFYMFDYFSYVNANLIYCTLLSCRPSGSNLWLGYRSLVCFTLTPSNCLVPLEHLLLIWSYKTQILLLLAKTILFVVFLRP